MIQVHLYGKMRRYAPDPRPDHESVLQIEPQPGETVRTLLERVGIAPSEPYHVFLNGALLATHNSMAPWLCYQQAGEGVPCGSGELDVPVQPGDRLGIFASDMALLVV